MVELPLVRCSRCVTPETHETIMFDAEGVFEFADLRQVVEGSFTFTNVSLPEPGEYRLKLFVGGEYLMERSLYVSASRIESNKHQR